MPSVRAILDVLSVNRKLVPQSGITSVYDIVGSRQEIFGKGISSEQVVAHSSELSANRKLPGNHRPNSPRGWIVSRVSKGGVAWSTLCIFEDGI